MFIFYQLFQKQADKGKPRNEIVLKFKWDNTLQISLCPYTGKTTIGCNGNFARTDAKAFKVCTVFLVVYLLCRYVLIEDRKNNM